MLGSSTAARIARGRTGIRLADGRLHLKAEHLQTTGSYKVRGMTWKVASLTPADRGGGSSPCRPATPPRPTPGRAVGSGSGRRSSCRPPPSVRRSRRAWATAPRSILHGAHVGESLERLHLIERERGLVFCSPLRRSGDHRRARQPGPGCPRRPARRRRRGRRGRRRRDDLRGGGRPQGAAALGPGLRCRAGGLERDDPGDRRRASGDDHPDERGRRPGRAVRRRVDPGHVPALPRRDRSSSTTRRSWPASGSAWSG